MNFVLYALLTALIIGFLTFIHEFGHFFFARLFKVPILEFSVGMGPTLFSWKGRTGTKYAVRALPIGGFVQMEGEEGTSENPMAYNNLSPLKKIIVTGAGPVVNIVFAILAMFVIVLSSAQLVSTTVGAFTENAISNTKLMVGDEIVKIENVAVHTGEEARYEIMMQGYRAIDITVIRDGRTVVLEDVPFYTDEAGVMGLSDFYLYTVKDPTILDYFSHAFFRSVNSVKMIYDSLIGLISGRFGVEALSGPIGIVDSVNDVANQYDNDPAVIGELFINFLVMISMNLGIFNLLPIPALDGGRIVFHLIDLVAGRKVIRKEVEDAINGITMILLLAFMLFISVKDVVNLF